MHEHEKWLFQRKAKDSAKIRLICFHYAAGNAAWFLPWEKYCGSDIALDGGVEEGDLLGVGFQYVHKGLHDGIAYGGGTPVGCFFYCSTFPSLMKPLRE